MRRVLRGLRRAARKGVQKVRENKIILAVACAAVCALVKPDHDSFLRHMRARRGALLERYLAGAMSAAARSAKARELLKRYTEYTDLLLLSAARLSDRWFIGALGTWLEVPAGIARQVKSVVSQPHLDVRSLAVANAAVCAYLNLLASEEMLAKHFTASKENVAERPYTLLTPCFSHISPIHLLSNVQSLMVVGEQVQGLLGPHRAVMVYLFGGLVSSLTSAWINAGSTQSLGASGSIYALLTVNALALPDVRFVWWGGLELSGPQMIVAQLGLDLLSHPHSGIDVFGHAGGAAAGFLYFWHLSNSGRLPLLPPASTFSSLL